MFSSRYFRGLRALPLRCRSGSGRREGPPLALQLARSSCVWPDTHADGAKARSSSRVQKGAFASEKKRRSRACGTPSPRFCGRPALPRGSAHVAGRPPAPRAISRRPPGPTATHTGRRRGNVDVRPHYHVEHPWRLSSIFPRIATRKKARGLGSARAHAPARRCTSTYLRRGRP